MKVSITLGTRPEAIKLAPVILALRAHKGFECHVCVTAQHREMLDQVLEVFDIVPDVDLNLMRPGQTLTELTCRAIESLSCYFAIQKPDLVLVQGDTTTVLSCSLAAFYHSIPIAHVEAGLRTGNLRSPWPEEANRVVTSHVATLHFAPTERNRRNLLAEGISPERIFVTGNTVIDALLLAVDRVRLEPPRIPGIDPRLMDGERTRPVVLITGHRRESFGEKLESICMAIAELAERFPETQFIYPVHLNPIVRRTVARVLSPQTGIRRPLKNVQLIDPLPYLQFVALMERATLILTDSGGIQEEAPSLGKPVLVTRDTTERPEALAAGTAKLVGADRQAIVNEVSRLLTEREYYEAKVKFENPYGDGRAAGRIVLAISDYFRLKPSALSREHTFLEPAAKCDSQPVI
jgi:UDP-N-acetylglucosamine 2-epimerase (non-hydrolysing)